MSAPHLDIAVAAFTAALGERLDPGIFDFADLFHHDAIIEVPFDGDGSADPIVGREAIRAMTRALEGILRFDEVTFRNIYSTDDTAAVICEYEALLHRVDLGGQYRRRYISVLQFHQGRVILLREYGGPFLAK